MIDGADIEDEDKDSIINSRHLMADLQTTRDVFLCKTEDSSDIEEIGGAESALTGGGDNPTAVLAHLLYQRWALICWRLRGTAAAKS